jgi:hypothetical protein
MRYRGGGVGHLATRQCNKSLLADKHTFVADPASQTLHEPTENQEENEDRADNDKEEDEGRANDRDEAENDGDEDEDRADNDEEEDGGRANDGDGAENDGDEDEDRADNESEGDKDCADNLLSGNIHDVDIVNAAGFAAL